jgi:S-adenosylmethionine hydrolase
LAVNASGIITLTTDFGLSDPYVAMMKGVILSIHPEAQIVDISHQIRAGSIMQAAGLVHETFPFFPKGTVHVAVVDPGVGSKRRPIGMEAGGHYFVGPDNGILWPIIEDYTGTRIIHLTESRYFLPPISHTFHGREVFAPVAAHLSQGVSLMGMGAKLSNPVRLHFPKPKEEGGILYGQITRVDNFGNLISNIHRRDLESFLEFFEPVIMVGNLTIKNLRPIYADVEEGEPLALINSSDWLEIAVNLGRAVQYMGLTSEEIIGTEVKVSKWEGPF